MLTETQDNEEIIARVAALDIGKAELVCCVRVPDTSRPIPDADRPGQREHSASASQAHSQAQPAANRHPAGIGRHVSDQEHQAIEHETRRTIATPGVVLALRCRI